MVGGGSVEKAVIGLFLLANVGMIGYNGWSTYDRTMARSDEMERVHANVVKIRRIRLDYEADMDQISQQKLVKVDEVSKYLEQQVVAAGFDPLRDRIQIPLNSDDSRGTRYNEETWKIIFTDRKKVFPARKIANLCRLIEGAAPGFQIKEVDLGQRNEVWGKDEWTPTMIVVRRLTPRAKEDRRN